MRVCAEPGCPELSDQARCSTHRRARDKARGTRQQRGYGWRHDQQRADIQRRIDNGAAVGCVTCGVALVDRAWDLGHNTDRTAYIGPQCVPCNRGHRDTR